MHIIDVADASNEILAMAEVLAPAQTQLFSRLVTVALLTLYREQATAERARGDRRYRCWLVIAAGGLVGAATIAPCNILYTKRLNIWIRPDWRGRGFATALLAHVKKEDLSDFICPDIEHSDFYRRGGGLRWERDNGQTCYLMKNA